MTVLHKERVSEIETLSLSFIGNHYSTTIPTSPPIPSPTNILQFAPH